ncbi:hypothetical protein MSAN_02091000 [Mycena sanguinolenta]|uniref:Uncharacterized protein n=1 Tax=Mycena sanguinolenta TaxID=230812 RepID=A0A8H7CKL7_9AGAR|nr:hypothetical protein MSAN_02091000 [Mycena sanguinolenta]
MGDYVPTIRLFGPTDSYSTQVGESLHRLVKRMYGITNKRTHSAQIAARVMRVARARAAARRSKKHTHHVLFGQGDPLGATPPDIHHQTSKDRRNPLDMYTDFKFKPQDGDPAMAVGINHLFDIFPADGAHNFVPKLKDHLLGRILKREFDGDTHEEFTDDDRNSIRLSGNKIYATRTLRVNYTTYDVRRDQDNLNPRTSSFVMVRSPETEAGAHPPILTDYTTPEPMDFLWVRWLGVEPGYRAGIKRARLPKVGFVPESDAYAFGFLDPKHIIRGAHLIPDFCSGRTNDLLATTGTTAARAPDDTEDWANYCVDIFLDRDMFMHYLGGCTKCDTLTLTLG